VIVLGEDGDAPALVVETVVVEVPAEDTTLVVTPPVEGIAELDGDRTSVVLETTVVSGNREVVDIAVLVDVVIVLCLFSTSSAFAMPSEIMIQSLGGWPMKSRYTKSSNKQYLEFPPAKMLASHCKESFAIENVREYGKAMFDAAKI
jgi:hypothetical protein